MFTWIGEWLAQFARVTSEGSLLGTWIGLGAMIGVVTVLIKHWGESKPGSRWHWVVLFHDVWKVSALSLTLGVTVIMSGRIHEAIQVDAEMAHRYACIDAARKGFSALQAQCPELADSILMTLHKNYDLPPDDRLKNGLADAVRLLLPVQPFPISPP